VKYLRPTISLLAIIILIKGCLITNIPDTRSDTIKEMKLVGDTDCAYGSKNCTPCVRGLLEQVSRFPKDQGDGKVYNFPNKDMGINYSIRKHAQGIARIPGTVQENWVAITRHHANQKSGAGVISIQFSHINSDGRAWQFSDTANSAVGQSRQLFSTEDNHHPGGCQIIGQNLAVAHYSGKTELPSTAWISFYDVSDPMNISETNRFYFDGTDDLDQVYHLGDEAQATGVALIRLKDNRYLMFAIESRRMLKYDIGWFYISNNTDLENPQWKFIQFWHQEDLLPNSRAFLVYENIQLITDCGTGKIFMLGFIGWGTRNVVDVFTLDIDDQKIVLKKVLQKEMKTRKGGASFRGGASVHITPDHEMVLYAVEKEEIGKWMMIEEFIIEGT